LITTVKLGAEKCRCDFTWESIIHTITKKDKQLTLNLLTDKNRAMGEKNMIELQAAGWTFLFGCGEH
jgi:hypothetical protein